MKLTHTLFSKAALALSAALLAAALATPATAGPIGLQANAGWYTESDAFFVGAGARMGAGTIAIVPNAEWQFVDNGSAWSFSVDGHLTLMPLGVGNVYAGGGLGWYTSDPDQGDSNTDTGINLVGGVGFSALPMKPFAQLKYVIIDGNDPFQFSFGVRF